MGHTYVSSLIHCVFSTKNRDQCIHADIQPRLWSYMGGIAREHDVKALAVGGMNDHAHLLLSLPSTISVAKAVQLIKGGSSKWMSDTFPNQRDFSWQEGYGGFSIGITQMEQTIAYIQNQQEHHREKTFQEEFVGFLKRHGIPYDERYVWG